jgi:hypothetical protein
MNAWWLPATNHGDLDGLSLLPCGRHIHNHDTENVHTSCIQPPHYKQVELVSVALSPSHVEYQKRRVC